MRFPKVSGPLKIGAQGFLLFGRVGGEPAMLCVFAVEEVWHENLVLAAMSEDVGTLGICVSGSFV